ncbi:PKD domain-containing protein [Maribacter thermophilus]|uniref:PKD domain-containing protein n=1 Tax=Maribacter thermophilus TaxID=1197874 RepID=UPI00069AFE49|nr:PKD domain-containing protein [Maribacter thermophilus]
MNKNYATKAKSFKNLLLTSSIIGSAALIMGFGPMFFGPGLTEAEPFDSFTDTAFSPAGTATDPYEVAFPNLDFDTPLNFNVVPGQNNIVVGQRDGKVYWFPNDDNTTDKNLVIDLSAEVGVVWDGGFLGLAIHPDFGTTGKNYFFVYYTSDSGNNELDGPLGFSCGVENFQGNYLYLERFEVDPTNLEYVDNSRVTMIKRRMYNTTHRGGGMEFGDDGFLYLSTGDQAAYINAQDIAENLDGGVLRIDVDMDPTKSHEPIRTLSDPGAGDPDEFSGRYYYIPDDNPFPSLNGDNFEEYYSLGHRNPHRMTKDRATGTFYIGEVGESTREEINVLSKGKNYGWPMYEGNLGPTARCGMTELYNNMPHEQPLLDFQRTEASSIIGGYVYNGSDMPSLQGKYICADYAKKTIWQVNTGTGEKQVLGNFTPYAPVSFGQDYQGELYILSQGNGVKLYRLADPISLEAAPEKLSDTGVFTDLNSLTVREGFIPYTMVDPFWSDGAYKTRWMAIPNDGTHDTPAEQIQFSENGDWEFPVGSILVKHFDYPVDDNDPTITKKIETRFSIKGADGNFYFLTYKWRPDESDADLVDMSVGETADIEVAAAGGGKRYVEWLYPSNSDCVTCHNPALGGTLGPRTRSLNRDFDYSTHDPSGTEANQLVTLSALGILNENITDTDTPNYLTHVAMNDVEGTIDEKARTYLDNNCAYCHQPATGNRGDFDLRLFNTLAQTGLLTAGMNESVGLGPDERIVYPGDASKSQLYHRVQSTTPGVMMPPLAKGQVDTEGAQLIMDWINQLQPLAEPPAAGNYRIVNRGSNETLQIFEGSVAERANVVSGGYEGLPEQHFELQAAPDGYYYLRAMNSTNRYLDVQEGGLGPNTNVWQYRGNGTPAQTWEIVDAEDGTFNIISTLSGYYLGQDDTGNVLVVENPLDDSIRWEFMPTSAPFTIGIDILDDILITSEDGTTDEFDVALKSAPSEDVVLLITGTGATDEFTLSDTELTFTPANWNVPQTVTVTGVDDADVDGVQYYDIEIAVDGPRSDSAYAGFVEVFGGYNEDNDGGEGAPPAPGIYRIINESNGLSIEVANAETDNMANIEQGLYQGQSHEQFELVYEDNGLYSLIAVHSGRALDVELGSSDPGTNIWQYTANGTPAQLWSIEDAGDGTYFIVSELAGHYLSIEPNGNVIVDVENGDDIFKWRFDEVDPSSNYGLVINKDGVYTDEDGDTDTFTVVLTEAPTAAVTVGVSATSGADEVTLSPTQLSFDQTNWDVPQTVTVTGVDDADMDGAQEVVIEVSVIAPVTDTNYGIGLGDDIKGTNYDNDGGDNGAPPPGIYRLRNVGNTLSIMPENGGLTRDTNFVTDVYDASSYQHFELVPDGNGFYSIKAIHDNLVLDIEGGNQNAGANVWMYTGNFNDAQLWDVVEAGDGSYYIISVFPGGYYLTVEPDGNVIVDADDGSDLYKWQFLPTGFEPEAVASADIISGNEPLTVQFTGSASTDDKNDIVGYLWDFGNGDSSTEVNPQYDFTTGGPYAVTLTVTDGDGYTDTSDAILITVNGTPESVASSDITSGNTPLLVNFTGDQSSDDNGIIGYLWNFGDGNTSSEINPSHTFNNPGEYEVELTVTDAGGLSDTSTLTITVNGAPYASIIADNTGGEAPVEVNFDGSSSTDDVGIVSYLWDFGDGASSTEQSPTHTFTTPGVYEVVLIVTDEGGLEDTATTTITVVDVNEAPVAVADANIQSGVAPVEIIFNGDQSTDDVGIVTYSWDFGDGTSDSGDSPAHTYTQPGVYEVVLTVTDSAGLMDSDSITITVVDNEAPIAIVSADVTEGEAPLLVTFTGDQSTDDVGIVSYNWDFGDGVTSSDANPEHTFDVIGTYDVILTVTDDAGLQSTASVAITVTEENVTLEQPSFEFILAPNPSTEYVEVIMKDNFDMDEIIGVMIHDSAGRLIRQFMVDEVLQGDRLRIPTGLYRKEVYVVTLLYKNNEPDSKRLIIQ